MKRIFSLLIVLCLLTSVAGATGGDPNIEGGGGGIGEGGVVGDSAWNPGDDGVRVSIMDGTTAVCTFDVSNVERTRTQACFMVKDKLEYKNRGGVLTPKLAGQYTNWTPPAEWRLPTIISSGGGNNIGAIREYFTKERTVQFIAEKSGIPYGTLIGGRYKLLLEPMAYFKYNGVQYAMSATEAALFDVKVSGDLRYQMGRMTHQNLPFAMFLERADLTIAPWTGPTTGRQSNIDILNQLGVGIVSFTPEVVLPEPESDYIYRTDTDVITSVQVPNLATEWRYGVEVFKELTPSDPGTAKFKINGTTYNVRMIAPARGRQNVWVRWRTPSTPGDIEITVMPPGGRSGDVIQITASIVELEEKTPPDPGYDGPGQGPGITGTEYRPNFRPVRTPRWGSNTHTSWSQWVAEWVSVPFVGGYWDWSMATYDAYLDVDFKLKPNSRVQTAEQQNGKYIIKSGYGLDAVCKVRAYGRGGVNTSDATIAQNVLAVFPEFDYTTYNRLLTPGMDYYHSAFPQVTWGFKRNVYSYYTEPTHFTPVWYPDTDYTVAAAVFDAWTPGGMLYATVEDTVKIRGTMYDDWYIRVT